MKIYDCFMFFDEELILEIRLNILNKYIDYFVIVESEFNHKGEKRELKFDIKNFSKFKKKIIYIIHKDLPKNLKIINESDSKKIIDSKKFYNATKRENSQRDFISEGIKNANDNDLILISDVDEIPNFNSFNFNKIRHKITVFEQYFFYYKFDLYIPNFFWFATKIIKKIAIEISPVKPTSWITIAQGNKKAISRSKIINSIATR